MSNTRTHIQFILSHDMHTSKHARVHFPGAKLNRIHRKRNAHALTNTYTDFEGETKIKCGTECENEITKAKKNGRTVEMVII